MNPSCVEAPVPGRSFVRILLDPLSSIWTGIVLLSMIITYSALGSAIPPLRQFFELSELGWFDHWLFGGLIGLFCLVLTMATVRRIRFNWVNAGVLTVHTGLLLLAGGSVLYFGGKTEGDLLLEAPQVYVLSRARIERGEGGAQLGSLTATEGERWEQNMPMAGGAYAIEVQRVRHDGLTLARDVTLQVTTGNPPETKSITLQNDGGHSRPVPLNEHVTLFLGGGGPQNKFHDRYLMALSVKLNGGEEARFALPQLPQYRERFVEMDGPIIDKAGRPVASHRSMSIPLFERWQMPIPVLTSEHVQGRDWPIGIEIDGFLPYAELRDEPVPGGERLNPIASITLAAGQHTHTTWLTALQLSGSMDGSGPASVEFRWLEDSKLPAEWTAARTGAHVLDVEIKDKGITRQYDVSRGQTVEVEGSDYRLTVDNLLPTWPLMTPGFEGARSPVAQISVETAGKKYQRTVIERFPQLSQDVTVDASGKTTRHREAPYDPNLVLRYEECSGHKFIIAAGPELTPVLVHTAPGGKRQVQTIEAGQVVRADDVALTLNQIIEKPDVESRPVVVPEMYRQRNLERGPSMVRVKLANKSGWTKHVWVPFTQFGYGGDPRRAVNVEVSDVGRLELVYGRYTRSLPGEIALERMIKTFHPGRMAVSDWRSNVRMRERDSGELLAGSAFLNHTFDFGPWTLFQSSAPSGAEDTSWTVLGVGNRIGIFPMTLGCVLISVGLIYAFCVKPALKAHLKEKYAMQARKKPDVAAPPPAALPAQRSTIPTVIGLVAAACLGLGASAAIAQEQGRAMPDDDIHRPLKAAADDGHVHSTEAHAHAPQLPVVSSKEAELSLQQMAPKLKLDEFRLLAAQHEGRYQTMEAWGRDLVKTVHGRKDKLFKVDPLVAALEILLNAGVHDTRPLIYLKDVGVRHDITAHPVKLPDDEIVRIRREGFVSRDFLRSPPVMSILGSMEEKVTMQRAMDRVSAALMSFESAEPLLKVVPDSDTDRHDAPWYAFRSLLANVDIAGHNAEMAGNPVPGVSDAQARTILTAFGELQRAWQSRDADAVNQQLAAIAAELPKLARPGVYPDAKSRRVEALYTRMGAFSWGWAFYCLTLLVSIWSVASRWRFMHVLALVLFAASMAFHGTGIGLRWYILGRIPVANMYESVVGAAFLGAFVALCLELALLRSAQIVYVLSLVASVWAQMKWGHWSWMPLLAVFAVGFPIDAAVTRWRRRASLRENPPAYRGYFTLAGGLLGFLFLALGDKVGGEITTIQSILDDVLLRIHTVLIILSYAIVTLAWGVANCLLVIRAWRYRSTPAWVTLGCEVAAAIALYVVIQLPERLGFHLSTPQFILSIGGSTVAGGLIGMALALGLMRRPTAIAMTANGVPKGLEWDGQSLSVAAESSKLLGGLDRAQIVLLSMANVGLFVGMILGAVWADYSWGRPWGWDAKEVFALTTWMIYAILIHVRYVARDRGLWTAIVACIGFAMMMFNYWAVNFLIVGLHSYA